MPPHVGRAMPRREDERLITGRGRYAGDIKLEGLTHMAIVRSPHAHARVTSINTDAAKQMPGVVSILTAHDLPATAKGIRNWLPPEMEHLARPVLVDGKVLYVGDAVAAVIAEHAYQAHDALAAIEVDYEPLPAVVGGPAALESSAPRVHDNTENNLARSADYTFGELDAAFARAPVTVKETFTTARICGAAMEPRVATATWHPGEGELTMWTSTQSTFSVRDTVADALGLDKDKVTVLAHDVGGGFGPKGTVYGEEVLVAAAAQLTQRPVTWTATRSEDTATTVHAHGTHIEVELAAEADGTLRGLRGHVIHDMGAYPSAGNGQIDIIVPHMMSAYVLPALSVKADVVYTNAAPTGFVRGGGRPLGNYVIERMLDRLAARIDGDPAEVRRKNLIQPSQMPYDTHFPQGKRSIVYDGGDYPQLLSRALKEIGYDELRAQQKQQPERDGKRLGIGIACCVESSGFGTGEPARVRIQGDGSAHLFIGSTPQGQGHETAAAQVLADRLGWPIDRIDVVAGDTRVVPWAFLTAGSRSAIHVGNAVSLVAKTARDRILARAAETLEANPADLYIEEAVVHVRGVPQKSVPVIEIFHNGFEVEEAWNTRTGTAYASSCHAAAVSIDLETGSVEMLKYVIVHDTGKVINPLLVAGQMHGGLAHGMGFALFEEAIYQPDGGFVSASFLDYTIPSAPEVSMPLILVPVETPTEANPEGFKGAGESATIAAPAAISNAIEDAARQVRPEVALTFLPITPMRLYELLNPS
ncbi:MAG: xanthine dehydrogenase family protein molybdopterin-binding subunit [Chloroflexota bacterium]